MVQTSLLVTKEESGNSLRPIRRRNCLPYRCLLPSGFLAILFIVQTLSAVGQSASGDSLEALLPHMRDDTAKVDAMVKVALRYRGQDPVRMRTLAFNALALADRLKDAAAAGHALYALGEAFSAVDSTVAAIRAFQRSLDAYARAGQPAGRIPVLVSLTNLVLYGGSKERAYAYAREGLALSRQYAQALSEARFLNLLSNYYFPFKNDVRRSIAYLDSAAEAYTRGKLPARTGYCLMQAGGLWSSLGEYRKSLPYLNRAADILEPLGDHFYQTFVFSQMAATYRQLGNIDSARFILRKAAEHAALTEQDRFLATVAEERGELSLATGDTTEAIEQFRHACDLYSPDVDRENIARISKTLSRLFAARRVFDQAYFNLSTSANLIDSVFLSEMRRQVDEVTTRYENEKTEQAIGTLEKDKALRDLELARQREVMARERLEADQRIRAVEADRELRRLESARAQAELACKTAETRQQKQELTVLDKDRQISESNLQRETLTRNVSISGAAVLLLTVGVLSHRYRERKRLTTRLENTLDTLQRTQAQLIHAEKMATLGEMTAGIAHEIKNPLNFVTNFSSLSTELAVELKDRLLHTGPLLSNGDQQELFALIDALKNNSEKVAIHGQRADTIISNMMMHARGQTGVRQMVDINRLVDDAVMLAESGQRGTVRDVAAIVKTEYDPHAGEVEVLPQEISRVVLNLVSNALYAAKERTVSRPGEVSRSTQNAEAVPTVWISTKRREGSIEVRVRDNGRGVPEEIESKIFQPFFTTKPTGEGTGLGLSMSYDIVVHGHNGTLSCTSSSEGAEFVMTLPIKILM